MKFPVDEIPQSPKEIDFSERIEDLNQICTRGGVRDFRFPEFLDVHLIYYRSGHELFFNGRFRGHFEGYCGRCLTEYRFQMEKDFEIVLSPSPAKFRRAEELKREDLGLSFYAAEEIDFAPLIMEQVMLALPTRSLCADDCRGLCGGCGVNLNLEACVCAPTAGDPRLAVFRALKISR